MVYDRVLPWYRAELLPKLLRGENVMLVAHGNSIRALVKYIENISDTDIAKFEMVFGTILVYTVDEAGRMVDRQTLKAEITQTKA